MGLYKPDNGGELIQCCSIPDVLTTPALTFYGSVEDIEKVDASEYSIGTVLINNKDQYTYLNTGSEWEPIGSTTVPYEPCETRATIYDPRMELVETKCGACGAPIKIRTRYETTVKCEYCGTTYRFEPKRD